MIVLFTDFGLHGPYLGQMLGALHHAAPGIPAVNLFADAPAFDPRLAAYLLGAYAPDFPAGSVFLCVVDPGVGGGREPIVVEAGGRRFVGPNNGLMAIAAARFAPAVVYRIAWRPERLSASFHGRDLFAPVAARLARGERVDLEALDEERFVGRQWPADLERIILIDGFGNAVSGVRALRLHPDQRLRVAGRDLAHARTFSDVEPGAAFWYENANGLVELAVNQGSAANLLALAVGDEITLPT